MNESHKWPMYYKLIKLYINCKLMSEFISLRNHIMCTSKLGTKWVMSKK